MVQQRTPPVTLLALAILANTALSAAEPSRPNIVLILVDDMGYGDPQCYNSESKIPTPNIDSLASDGMKFTDAHASGPLCHVSRYGLVTGRYPFRGNPGRWAKQPVIPEDEPTVGGMLQSAGYRTAMVGKWHLGFAEDGYQNPLPGGPVDRGFDTYFGIRASTDIPPYFYIRGNQAVEPPTLHVEAGSTEGWTPIQGEFWRAGGIAPNLKLKDVLPRFTEEAIDVITKHAKGSPAAERKPLFLYLAYPAPHTPWLPSKEFLGKSGASMYGDFATMVDANIGQILNAVAEQGMGNDTLVIFSSDNGPVWYPHDVERFGHDAVNGLRGMKADAWEGGHRMPFLVRWPGRVRSGSVSDQTISFVDVFATLADLTGTSLDDEAAIDSFSFLPELIGSNNEKTTARTELIVHSGSRHRTLRQGDWKFIDRLGSGGFSQPKRVSPKDGEVDAQLYDLSTDLGEKNNLASQELDRIQTMKQRLNEIERSRGHRFLSP